MFTNIARTCCLAVLMTLLAAPLSNMAWVGEKEGKKNLLGSYLAGRMARSQRDNTKAAEFYENALAQDPGNELILERTFLLEAIAGDWNRALLLAKDVAKNEPSHQIARFLLGAESFKKGKFSEAEKHFVDARKGAIAELTARLALAWTHHAKGNTNEALAELGKMKKADWSRFYQQYHKGLIADVSGKRKQARAALSDAFKSRPRTLRIAEAYARHAVEGGNKKLALSVIKQHIGKSRGHPIALSLREDIEAGKKPGLLITKPEQGLAEVFYAIGDALTGDDSTEMGLVYLRIALYLKPDFPLAYLSIGEVYDRMERFTEAINYYDKVGTDSPIWKNIQIRKAYALNSQDKTDEAKELLVSLAAKMGDDPRAFDALGSILRSKQRYDEAEGFYSKAIELVKKPEARHWTLFYARGVCRERLKRWPEAEKDLQAALKLSPDQPLILNYLGYSWVDQGLYLKKAMDLIRKAVKLKPDDGYFVDSLGWAHYRLGAYKDAVVQLERAVELRPEDPVINDHLGDALWRVGRRLEARYQWSQALTLEPEPEDEKKIKEKLAGGLKDEDATKSAAGEAKKTAN